jgi:hypothetical protein
MDAMLANDETDRLLYACILNVDHDNKKEQYLRKL